MNRIKLLPSAVIALLLSAVGLSSLTAQDKNVVDANGNKLPAAPTASAPAGLLPVPDYSADFWTSSFLAGDWGGVRTDWANKGIQVGAKWTQYVQGVASGGADERTEYGANLDYTINLDLMRMGLLPGALIRFRAESRYGSSVNGASGSILPVNNKALFPLSSELDGDVGINITDLNWVQFLSPNLGVFFGKLDTLDGDPNEFASGRGTSQFMNGNFLYNPTLALRLPYSTLGLGIIWMPIPAGPKGGITVSSSVVNTTDSSSRTGFEDFDKGTSWSTEADFTYQLGDLPGGMNVGGLYSFNQDFRRLNTRIVFQPGEGLVIPNEDSTWAVYASGWQYLFVDDHGAPVARLEGQPKHRGLGVFARVGIADKETNPVEWAVSGGIGGRGLIPSRDNDSFGVGYYYNSIQTLRLSDVLGLNDSTQGFECFYNVAVTPGARLTLDLQVVDSVRATVDTAVVLGVRASLDF